jgi:hypothetical protein
MILNMGKTDRILRIIAGLVIIALGFLYNSYWGVIGLVPLVTALVGWCPLYAPFKFSTKGSQGKSGA